MGARSYSKHRTQEVSSSFPMETNYINPNNSPDVDQDTPLSGAYIRNLVKQLTTCNSSSSSSSSPPPTPLKTHQKSQSNNTPHKKQVRRRLHTTKPYQERLLNMAEARKEIVTALKFHRANMKQQQQQQQQEILSTSPQHFQETNFFSSPPPPPPPGLVVLPNQTLGLSLSSFQDLTSLDAACLHTATNDATSALSPLSVLPDPAGGAMLMSSSADPSEVQDELQLGGDHQQGLGLVGSRALGEVEMEEMKSIGEMHEMEWNDTINLANSAWWFMFLKESDNLSPTDYHKFEQVVEYDPTDHVTTTTTTDANFYPDFELPCMHIEDIEGLDEEWLI